MEPPTEFPCFMYVLSRPRIRGVHALSGGLQSSAAGVDGVASSLGPLLESNGGAAIRLCELIEHGS